MKAKEMFKKYGLEYNSNTCDGELVQIIYKNSDKYSPKVVFSISNRSYKVFFNEGLASNVDIYLHKCIAKQIKELKNSVKSLEKAVLKVIKVGGEE